MLEQLTRTEASLLREGDEIVEVVGDVTKPEGCEARREVTHGRPPVCVPTCRRGRVHAV